MRISTERKLFYVAPIEFYVEAHSPASTIVLAVQVAGTTPEGHNGCP